MDGHGGDELMWDGLVCPPLEDYTFNFDAPTFTLLNDMFDDAFLEIEQDGDVIANYNSGRKVTGKPNIHTHPYGHGKEFHTLRQVLHVEKHSKTTFHCPPKDGSRLGFTNHVVVVDNMRKTDYDLRSDGRVTTKAKVTDNPNYSPHSYGNYRTGKDFDTATQAMNLNKKQIKAFLGETEELVENRDKKRKFMDCYDCQFMKRKDMTRLDNKNQYAGVDNMRIVDYESRFEASRRKLHVAYKQAGDAKQQKQIQVIDFQKPVTNQPKSKAKSKERPSLRQKLMVMGTRKSNKKFPPIKTFSSCI